MQCDHCGKIFETSLKTRNVGAKFEAHLKICPARLQQEKEFAERSAKKEAAFDAKHEAKVEKANKKAAAAPKEPGWLGTDVKPEDMEKVGAVVAAIAETKTGKSVGVLGSIPLRFLLIFIPFLGPHLLIKGHAKCPWHPTLQRFYLVLIFFSPAMLFWEMKRSSFDFEAVWAEEES